MKLRRTHSRLLARLQLKSNLTAGLLGGLLGGLLCLGGCAQFTAPVASEPGGSEVVENPLADGSQADHSEPVPVAALPADPAAQAPDGADAGNGEALPAAPVAVNPYLAAEPVLSATLQRQFADALAKAKAAGAEAEIASAVQAFTALLAEQPKLSGARVNLAQLYRQQGQPVKALSELQQAVSDNPNNLDGWNLLGILQRQQGDFAAAEQSYLAALQRWPDYAPAHLNIAILYELYMGRFRDALSHYQAYQALQTEPDRRVKGWIMLLQRRIDTGEGV